MDLSLTELTPLERYKILVGLVFPRPIALISTWSPGGIANCAPYSFFNAVCEDPPLVMASFSPRSDGRPKHSLANALRTGEFVVNLVDGPIANGMHASSAELAGDESEFTTAGFTPLPCLKVAHPRIAEAPASFECRLFRRIEVSAAREILLGEVLHVHARDGLIDPVRKRVSETAYRPVGRLYGNRYCTTDDRFDLPGPVPGT